MCVCTHTIPAAEAAEMRDRMKWITALLLGCIMMTGMPVSASGGMGYGQGTQVDADNRPTGALEFNAQFGKYNAYAIAPDETGLS